MALLALASLFSPVSALTVEYAENTNVGYYTTAWAKITIYIHEYTGFIVQGIWEHDSWSGGSQGSWSSWLQQNINWKQFDSQGNWVGVASETNTYPVGGGPRDAHAFASLLL